MTISTGYIINQRYRIVKTLTQGGFGRLYRAWDLSLKRPVALKQNLEQSEIGRAQFETEALILADLHHPNLARVTDYFITTEEGQFLVMDFVDGEDLQSLINRIGPLPEDQAILWINQVCDALSYIHNQRPPIIHRDIKPANIRITPDGKAVLVDFGIAKTFSPDKVTVTGARAVTPGYAPVEQYGSARTDARSDIYAIGATLYTLLTGKEPPESIYLVSGTELPKLRQVNVQITPTTEVVVHTAMALNPSDRYQSIDALQAALKRREQPATIPRNRWIPKAVIAFLFFVILADAFAILSSLIQVNIITQIIQGESLSGEDILRADQFQQAATLIQFILWGFTMIWILIWIYSTCKYLKGTTREFEYTPGWAVTGCLIPFYNIIHPYQVMVAIWKSSQSGIPVSNDQIPIKVTRLIIGWWVFSLASIFSLLTAVIAQSGDVSLSQTRVIGMTFLISYMINGIAAVLTILLVNKIDSLQEKQITSYGELNRTIQL